MVVAFLSGGHVARHRQEERNAKVRRITVTLGWQAGGLSDHKRRCTKCYTAERACVWLLMVVGGRLEAGSCRVCLVFVEG